MLRDYICGLNHDSMQTDYKMRILIFLIGLLVGFVLCRQLRQKRLKLVTEKFLILVNLINTSFLVGYLVAGGQFKYLLIFSSVAQFLFGCHLYYEHAVSAGKQKLDEKLE